MPGTNRQSVPWLVVTLVGALLAASPLAAGESRWYLAGRLGQASIEADFGPPLLGWRLDGEETAASIEVGYAVHRYLGLQLGYHHLGSYAGQPRPCPDGQVCPTVLALPQLVPVFPVEAELTGFSLAAVPRWPVTERFSVFGKLGVLGWDAKVSRTPVGNRVESPSGEELLTGLGAGYDWPKGFGLLLEYERTDLADAVSLGARWRF